MNNIELTKRITEKLVDFENTTSGFKSIVFKKVNDCISQFQKENIRAIRFYCQQCGKELFEGIDLDSISSEKIELYLMRTKYCDDCLLDDIRSSQSSSVDNIESVEDYIHSPLNEFDIDKELLKAAMEDNLDNYVCPDCIQPHELCRCGEESNNMDIIDDHFDDINSDKED